MKWVMNYELQKLINQNITLPGASATGGTLTCTTTSIVLSAATTSGTGFSWAGTGIVSGGTTANPRVGSAGTFTVTVTNGCTSTATALVNSNITPPGASATGGTLTCTTTNAMKFKLGDTVYCTLFGKTGTIVYFSEGSHFHVNFISKTENTKNSNITFGTDYVQYNINGHPFLAVKTPLTDKNGNTVICNNEYFYKRTLMKYYFVSSEKMRIYEILEDMGYEIERAPV